MKAWGMVLIIMGALGAISSLKLWLTLYRVASPHDLSRLLGSVAITLIFLGSGMWMVKKKP